MPHEARTYDALGRIVESARPDGAIVRHEHRRLAVAVYDGNDTAQAARRTCVATTASKG
jgi:hypothetical protein